MYGQDHLNERLSAIDRLGEIREDSPEYITSAFMTEMWEGMVFRYCACVTEGVYHIIGRYDEGISLEKIRRYALSPSSDGGTAWRFSPTFDFGDENGFWQARSCPG